MRKKLILIFTAVLAVVLCCLVKTPEPVTVKTPSVDLDSIRKRGKLIVVTDFNSTDYFIYNGEPMGFNYELLKAFSSLVGIKLEIITENNIDKACEMLAGGKADIVATGVPDKSSKDIRFTRPLDVARQVLVRRKNFRMKHTGKDALAIQQRRNLGLSEKTIYFQTGFPDLRSLMNASYGLGDSIRITEVPFDQETLIRYVSEGVIDFSVCDENIALVNSTYYPNIDISTPVSSPQNISWAVRKNGSDSLLTVLNKWITDYKKTTSFAFLYAKYFRNSRSGILVNSRLYSINTGRISPYDEIIRKFSASIKWDWRLVASLICQESHFDPDVESATGAIGLMQVMPETAKIIGMTISSSPEENIRAGIRYINFLYSIFDHLVPDEKERIYFILAAYNAGPGHVVDAIKLAEKNGFDPHRWAGSVDKWLTNKADPKYYNDEVVRNGYFRGEESVAYVNQILARYEQYKNVVP